MQIWTILVLAFGVSMDAFSISVCKGLAARRVRMEDLLVVGLWFGGFQAIMPLIGYLIGTGFGRYIEVYDHWVAFGLLFFLGLKMIVSALRGGEETATGSFATREMFPMAVATSIDALAVGVSLAILPDVRIGWAVALIGLFTFGFSAFGVKLGNLFGARFRHKSELAGGIILALVGTSILLEHLGLL